MKRGRKPLMTPTVEWKCRIPVDIAVKIDTFLLDPVRQEVAYGRRSQLVTQLLRAWLETTATATNPQAVPATPATEGEVHAQC